VTSTVAEKSPFTPVLVAATVIQPVCASFWICTADPESTGRARPLTASRSSDTKRRTSGATVSWTAELRIGATESR
jgi:hypothetical protein